MNGWQEPKDGKRIYIITDNTKMDGFTDYIKSEDVERLYVTYSESRVNLGIHYYRNKLYTSNLVGICRIKSVDDETLYDAEGNELLIKVIPRFNVKIVELLNYMRDDDEFDRYMAPQTISNRHKERDIEAIDRNEIFYFYVNENPLKVDEKISGENSIITVTVFLTLLRLLCKKPLMGRMMKKEKNLTGKVKGKIVIEKNIRANTMHGRNDRFYCQYLQFSEDIIENQILKAALKKSKRFVIEYFKDCGKDNNNYTSMISYCSNALRNISDIQCDGEACNAYLGFVLTNKTSIADSDKFGRQLKDWMRVMTTLSRETNYNGGDDYERAISKGVRRLLPYSSDIISHLAEITEYSGYGFDSDCFEEECLKAKLMKRDDEWKELILNAEDNKYFNGQIGFLLEAAGILSKYENGEIDGWTAEEDKNSKNAFRKYLKIYGSIFGEFEYGSKKEKYVGINRSFANNLRRALLCKGDYHLDDSNNSSFLVDFDRDISWKRLLRIQSNEKHGTYKTRRKMLMDLINDPLFDINDIGGGLINICNRDIGKITNWRKYFISVPGVMDALHDYSAYKPKERYIRIEGDNIFLMGSTRLYGYNKEYYSFALCCMLECLGKYSVRYEDAKGWEDIHHQIEVTEKSTGEVYEIKYRRSDKKFSIYKKDGSATVYANLEDTFNALK